MVRGWWWPNDKGGTADMVGCDLVKKQQELGTSVIQNNTGSYGVKSIVLRPPNGSRCYGYYNPSNIIEVVNAGMTASTNAAGINLCCKCFACEKHPASFFKIARPNGAKFWYNISRQ